MTQIAAQAPMTRTGSIFSSPLLWLGAMCAALLGVLMLKATLPVGPFYWDLFIYFDAANRIFSGQIPSVDFFAPVGPLGYWLFAGFVKLFPQGQPLLIAQWSLLLVSAPMMALVLADVDRRSRSTAFALLVPFLVFSILPFNVEEYYFYPGVDGYGIYNRQVCQLLYVLTAGLVFARGQKTLLVVMAGTMLALFLTKITGIVAGVGLCAFAFLAGRIALRTAVAAALGFFAVLVLLQLALGLTGAYLGDILQLVLMNESSLLPRFLQAASIHFIAFGPLAVLTGVLFFLDIGQTAADAKALARRSAFTAIAGVLDRDLFWLGILVLAGLFIETQNTGGQAFIFVWPVLLAIFLGRSRWQGGRLVLVLTLVAASSLPTLLGVTHRAARAFVGQLQYVALPTTQLGTLGAVSQRQELIDRAATMIGIYRQFPQTWRYFAENETLPSFMLYSEPDFQLTWMLAADEAVGAVQAYEAAHGVHFATLMNLNFVNPFPWLLDRAAPRRVAIGADPFRAVPDPDADVLDAVAGTDLLLAPLCPTTNANLRLLKLYQPALAGHHRVSLSPCWDGYVRDGLQPKS